MKITIKRKLSAKQKDGIRLMGYEKASAYHDQRAEALDRKDAFYKARKEKRSERKKALKFS